MKKTITLLLVVLLTATMMTACAKEAMNDVESAVSDVSSKISSGVDDMMGDSSSRIPSDDRGMTESVTETYDDPTDGDFGEPNVNDYDDNDSDVAGDENETDAFV